MATKEKKPVKITSYKPEQIEHHIGLVKRDGEKLKTKIHSLAISIAKAWHDNPNQFSNEWAAKMINALQAASPYHSNAFSKWVGMKLPFAWNEELEEWVAHADHVKLMGKAFIAARDEPFWEVSPPTKAKPFDDILELRKLLERARKRNDDKKTDEDVVHMGMWREVNDIIKKYEKA